MALTVKDFLADHPVDRANVDAHKARLLGAIRACQLRELREEAGSAQAQLGERTAGGQRERGWSRAGR